MKNHGYRFLAAIISFTRLPLPYQRLNAKHFAEAINYLPLLGLLVGGLVSLVYLAANAFLPTTIALFLAMSAGILITGALHEDGFADCCDGFAASRDKDTVLRIMKDPSNGTFATLGLISLLLGKLLFLLHIPADWHIPALLFMHSLARLLPPIIVATTPHCAQQQSKMSGNLQLNLPTLSAIALLLSLLCCFLLPASLVISLLVGLMLLAVCCRAFFLSRLQGFNGDCLGFTEQLGELGVLFLFVVVFS